MMDARTVLQMFYRRQQWQTGAQKDLRAAIEKAIDSLQRDEPLDAIAVVLRNHDGSESRLFVCSRCNHYVGANMDYCPYCGQRLGL